MLDLGDCPDQACTIALIPQIEQDAVVRNGDSDAVVRNGDSDGLDVACEGQTGHLSARLNLCKQIMTGTFSLMMSSPSICKLVTPECDKAF